MEVVRNYTDALQIQSSGGALGVNKSGDVVKLNRFEAFFQKIGNIFRSSASIANHARELRSSLSKLQRDSALASLEGTVAKGPRDMTRPLSGSTAASRHASNSASQKTTTSSRMTEQQQVIAQTVKANTAIVKNAMAQRASAVREFVMHSGLTAAVNTTHKEATLQQRKALTDAARQWFEGLKSSHPVLKNMDPRKVSHQALRLFERTHPEKLRELGLSSKSVLSTKGETRLTESETILSSHVREKEREQETTSPKGNSSTRQTRFSHADDLLHRTEQSIDSIGRHVESMERQMERTFSRTSKALEKAGEELEWKLDSISDMMDDVLSVDGEDDQVDAIVRQALNEAHGGRPPKSNTASELDDIDRQIADLEQEVLAEMEEEDFSLEDDYLRQSDSSLHRNIIREMDHISRLNTEGMYSDEGMKALDGHIQEAGRSIRALMQHSTEALEQEQRKFDKLQGQVEEMGRLLTQPFGDVDEAALEEELNRIEQEMRFNGRL